MPVTQPRSATAPEALARFVGAGADHHAYCVAYSGGVDSHVLLHAMAALCSEQPAHELRALHIDHGLQTGSADWADHCRLVCEQLQVPLVVRQVSVSAGGDGPEGDARRARYRSFVDVVQPDEQLLLAQHADDQAETFLLQALRGSGPDGLAAMPARRVLGQGELCRPLLDCTQAALLDYAEVHELNWIVDPSNEDSRFDRNYLRQEVMPLLRARWPSMCRTLSRSAQRSGGASRTLLSLARDDLDRSLSVRPDRRTGARLLDLPALRELPRERQFNVLRLWVRQHGKPMPRLQDLVQVVSGLIEASESSAGLVSIGDYSFRRHANQLHLVGTIPPVANYTLSWSDPYEPLSIEQAGLVITREQAAEQGLQLPEGGTVLVRKRRGGEALKMGVPPHHKRLKNVWQEQQVPPWQRDTVPLLFHDGQLIAIWGLAVASAYERHA